MEKLNKIILIGGAIIVALLLVIAFQGNDAPLGSVARGGEYKSTNLSAITTTTATLIKTGVGTLGSVVFSTSSDRTVSLFDVAAAANTASTTLSTRIITFATGTVAGVYTLDLSFYRGLAMEATPTTSKNTVITWR